MFSVGLAVIVNRQESYNIAIVNIIYGFIYNYLEDGRLINIFGHSYSTYAKKVPRCIPRIHIFSLYI
jgi:protein-S-isoprenylcysteine O-methyltransferase Ste14